MSDDIVTNYSICPNCKNIIIHGQHISWNAKDQKYYHSSCLIEKLRKVILTLSSTHIINESVKTRHLTYLASPYTHDDITVKVERYEMAVFAAYKLIKMVKLYSVLLLILILLPYKVIYQAIGNTGMNLTHV